jgi:ribosomal RNA assembly protein
MEYEYILKIPKGRIAVLIGKEGEIKKEIESNTDTRMDIDSKNGEVKVMGEDPLKLYITRKIIKAISRGFNPKTAQLLLKPDYILRIISLDEFIKKKNHRKRLKGRVIGKEGKARKTIEELTDCNMCVYGKTISIIGFVEDVETAARAVILLLEGSPHSNIFRFLEKKKKDKIGERLKRE